MKLHVARMDIEGGLIATFFALPIELIYGRIAVSPLGPQHFSSGIQSALWTCVMTGFLATVFRGAPGVMNGSSAKIALILSALTATLMKNPLVVAFPNPTEMIFALLFMCTMMAGLSQCIFSLIKIGRSFKFIPYPVIAGTMVGSAILMAQTALIPTFGVTHSGKLNSLISSWHPLSIVVSMVTLLLCLKPLKIFGKLPFMLVALTGGTLVHYGLSFFIGDKYLGTTWSGLSGLLPPFSFWHFALEDHLGLLASWVPAILPYSVAIAAVASMESMLCLPTVEAAGEKKVNSEKILWSQGLSNVVVGFFGGFPSEGVRSRSGTSVANGATGTTGTTSSLRGVAYSVALAVLIIFGSEVIGKVPEAATAGLILYMCVALIDDGTRRLITQVFLKRGTIPRAQYKMLWANTIVLAVVAAVAVFAGMLWATGVGVVAAMILFILTSMKPVIRNVMSAKSRRSLKVRDSAATTLLETEGERIRIIELDGILFFGTAEDLATAIGKQSYDGSVVILDFSKVKEIDATAARTLYQLARRMHKQNQEMMICGASSSVEADLTTGGLKEVLSPACWFADCDHALEQAEDDLLSGLGFEQSNVTLPLAGTMLATGLSAEESSVLEQYLDHRELPADSFLFMQGDQGNSLFVAASGVIDIRLPLRHAKSKRVASFAPGVIVGEMAFIEGMPRSAEGHVKAPTALWELTRQRFDEMTLDYPQISHKVMLNLSRGLSERLRRTTENLRAASANSDFNAISGALLPGQTERRRHAR